MFDILHEADCRDPAATSIAMQTEPDQADMADAHSIATFDIFNKHKQGFIEDVKREVKKYFANLGVRRCLDLVEVEETRNTDGSISARQLQSHPFDISPASWARLRMFMRQHDANQQQVPVRRFLDSAHTVIVGELVQYQFKAFYRRESADMAAYFLDLELQLPSNRAHLCCYARERLRSREPPLTNEQLADVGSLDDSEIVSDILRLVPESGEENYRRAMAFLEELLFQPTESQTALLAPHLIPRSISQQISAGSEDVLENLVRPIIISHLIRLLVGALGGTTLAMSTGWIFWPAILVGMLYPLLQRPTFSAMLGDRIATSLATDLDKSFKEKNEAFLKDFVQREGDAVMELLVDKLLSSDTRAKIIKRISGLSPLARKALATKQSSPSQHFTKNELDLISSEKKYNWLKELRDLRVSDEDITELLLHEHQACPWVLYGEMDSDEVQPNKKPLSDHHFTACAHHLLETKHKVLLPVESRFKTSFPASFEDVQTIAKLHRHCGLAGIFPIARKEETWNEFVEFEGEEDAVARVSFASFYSPDATSAEDILKRIIGTLEGLCTAFEDAQQLDLCCNSFTVLCIPPVDGPANIEAFRIQIRAVWQLLEGLRSVFKQPENWASMAFFMLFEESPLRTTLQPFLGGRLGPLLDHEIRPVIRVWLHFCSLAAQFLSLAFLSYTQAHKGDLFPSFLAKPLRQAVLCGAGMPDGRVIGMATRPLTCIGDMLSEPAICFQGFTDAANSNQGDSLRHDIYANLADIVDTWGPAELLCVSSDQAPFAMRIGGGILYTEDANGAKYHWSRTVDLKHVSRNAMDSARKLLIGAVRVNNNCQSNYDDLWRHASLETLGTQGRSWYIVFDNLSLSVGGLFRLTAQASVKHSAGRSHKDVEKSTAVDDDDVMALIDYRSAVQVSYCTGICRRVRFRDMVADLLPAFRPASVSSEASALAWQRLLDREDLLRGDSDVNLQDADLFLFKEKVKEMYKTLFHSGMNSNSELLVAWPSAGDRRAYNAIPCSGANAWAEILSESRSISSYAYIAPHCLQAVRGNPSACQSGWAPGGGLSQVRTFATKVKCVDSSRTVDNLDPGSLCFFQLLRKMVFAQVHCPDGEPVTLRVVRQWMPASALRRLLALRYQKGRPMTQLQEIRAGNATWAEEVLIECAPVD